LFGAARPFNGGSDCSSPAFLQITTASTGRLKDHGIAGPRPKRTTRSGRLVPRSSKLAKDGRSDATSTGWFTKEFRISSAVARKAKRS
jgi:hypothetical protein